MFSNNFEKNGLGYILGDFSQTHLVTLLPLAIAFKPEDQK
jgi:hypothetical protein